MMKNILSFKDYIGQKSLVTEAVLDTSRTGAAKDAKLDLGRSFADQRDQLLAGRWSGISPYLILGLLKFSPNWKPALNTCQIEEVLDGADSVRQLDIVKAEPTDDGYSYKILDAGGQKWNLDMQFPGKAQGIFMGTFRKRFPTAKPSSEMGG